MGKPSGFLEYQRQQLQYRPVEERLKDYCEMELPLSPDDINKQAARCMDCGTPFCHGIGCPLGNLVPEFNEQVYQNNWQKACDILHSTNNFPEITGRVCPAPCEAACTLSINNDPVTIKHIEFQIVEKGFENGWIKPLVAKNKTGKKVAVIGSGPAGLAAAQQLARYGHDVTVFEKDYAPGGLLRIGIPDFKLGKKIIDRRLEQMEAEGVKFQNNVVVGQDISAKYIQSNFDAICICIGAGTPRDLPVTGRELDNVHFAMDFLSQQNLRNAQAPITAKEINAKGKTVIVIGGGDTGSDCVGTSNRQGAKEVHQFEILPKPTEDRQESNPWPQWPLIMRTSTSHKEGCNRRWSVMTKALEGTDKVKNLIGVEVNWTKDKNGQWQFTEKKDSQFSIKADLVLLAMGFVHCTHNGLVEQLGVSLDDRGNVITKDFMTSVDGVFAAGDTVSGASLVVRAIDKGRKTAQSIHSWLKNR